MTAKWFSWKGFSIVWFFRWYFRHCLQVKAFHLFEFWFTSSDHMSENNKCYTAYKEIIYLLYMCSKDPNSQNVLSHCLQAHVFYRVKSHCMSLYMRYWEIAFRHCKQSISTFSLVWVLKCVYRVPYWTNDMQQSVQGMGYSLVCILICLLFGSIFTM